MEVNWKKTDGLEVAAGDVGYGIGLETPIVGSRWTSALLAEPTASGLTAPESELVTELETVDACMTSPLPNWF